MCGLKIFIFFLPKSFRTFSCQEQVSLWEKCSWNIQMLGFTFAGQQNCWLERSQRGDILIPWIFLKYSPIIFGLRGMNSYDACYCYPRYFYNRKKTSQNNNVETCVLAMWPKLYVLSTSSYVGAQRMPLIRRNVVKNKNIPEV